MGRRYLPVEGNGLARPAPRSSARRSAGLILLAIAGTLPEIAIVASAALAGHLDLAVGNLIGGIAIQTLVLVVLDVAAGREAPAQLPGRLADPGRWRR